MLCRVGESMHRRTHKIGWNNQFLTIRGKLDGALYSY